jgi:hypothetical protein
MKNIFYFIKTTGLFLACFCMLSISRVQAQTEVIVNPGLNTIQEALAANPGATLVLQRGGDYLTDIPIVISVETIIKGQTEPVATKPAVVSFIANPGEGGGGKLFMCSANSTLKDFGMMGYTPDEQQIAALVSTATDDITITLDGCIFQGATAVLEFSGHNNNHYIQKNNIYFNLAGQIWDNWCGFASLWGGANVDFQSYNNTFFICGRVFNAAGTGNNGTEIMNHNSYVNTWGDTFFPIYNDNVSVTNNIFFNSQIRGFVGERTIPYPTGDSLYFWPGDYSDWSKDTYPGLLEDDTLIGDIAIIANHADSSGALTREIFLTNNLKMYDSRVLDFYAANNVTVQPFTNKQNHLDIEAYGWVYKDNLLQEDGNSVDPQFAMGAIPEGAYTNMFKTRQERWLPKSMQSPEFPYENAWRPGGETRGQFIWPLPFDLKPMNNAIYTAASDGYPLGDLNWFGDEVVAAWEAGLENPLATAVIDLKTSKLIIYVDQNQQLQNVNGMVSIYDITGRLVIKEYANTGSISVGSLKEGIYIVHSNNSSTKISIR